jgi:hypothetical protein
VPRIGPSRAFQKRDFHRRTLTLHVAAWMVVLVGAFLLNREYTPDRFWLPWVGLAALLALAAHGVVFARSTLATMGRKD